MASRSKHDEKTVWRSSSLAVLVHGLSNPDDKFSKATFATEMEETAEERWVRLKGDEHNNLHLIDIARVVVQQHCSRPNTKYICVSKNAAL